MAEESLTNAVALIDEVELLLASGAVPRAYSLAILAAEEFGKCQLAVGAIGHATKDQIYWKEWWSAFYFHDSKLVQAAYVATSLIPEELVDAFVAVLDPALKERRRESGFYVDVVDGVVVPPAAAIKVDKAQHAVEVFATVIHAYAAPFEGVGLEESFLAVDAGPARDMRAAVESRDPRRIAETWEATTGRRLSQDELDAIMETLDPGSSC